MIVVYYGVNLSLSLFFFPSSSSSGFSISPGLAPPSPSPSPSPQGYTSVLQMFCPSQIYSFCPPPLDMAKEAICALLAILEHFFEAFSPLDLFFAPAPFRPVPRPFPASLHPGCRHLTPLPIPFLHRFQPIPSPARPLKSTSSRPGSHPSRRHPPVLSSSSELLSLSLAPLPRLHPACAFLPVPAAAPTLAPSCASQPLPDPVGHPAHGQNALWRWCP